MRPNVEEIRERVSKATAGPWKVGQVANEIICVRNPRRKPITTRPDADGIADAEFIAHARTDIPALLAYIDELETMLLVQTVVKLQEENERLQQDYQAMYERALKQHNEIERLRTILDDFKDFGTRHEMNPSVVVNRPLEELISFYNSYISGMDSYVRGRASQALEG